MIDYFPITVWDSTMIQGHSTLKFFYVEITVMDTWWKGVAWDKEECFEFQSGSELQGKKA